jgi:hypothetical protein
MESIGTTPEVIKIYRSLYYKFMRAAASD